VPTFATSIDLDRAAIAAEPRAVPLWTSLVDGARRVDWAWVFALISSLVALSVILVGVLAAAKANIDWRAIHQHDARLKVARLRANEPTRKANRAIAAMLPAIGYSGRTRPTVPAADALRLARPFEFEQTPLVIRAHRTASAAITPPPLTHSEPPRVFNRRAVAMRRPAWAPVLAASPAPVLPRFKVSPSAIAFSPRPPRFQSRPLPASTALTAHLRTPPNPALVREPVVLPKPKLAERPGLSVQSIRVVSRLSPLTAAAGINQPTIRHGHDLTFAATPIPPAIKRTTHGLRLTDTSLGRRAIRPNIRPLRLSLPAAPAPRPAGPPLIASAKLAQIAVQSLPVARMTEPHSLPHLAAADPRALRPGWLNAMLAPAQPRIDGRKTYKRGRCVAPTKFADTGKQVSLPAPRPGLTGDAFGLALAKAADRQRQWITVYSAKYQSLPYPMGDLPLMFGSCSDVIIRAYRTLGYDLQAEIQRARVGSGDRNIDHRRTNTLRKLFARKGQSFSPSPYPENYKPGDIVTYYRPFSRVSRAHIAIVSHLIAPTGRPYIIHNRGYNVQLEDALFVDRMTGHYRFRPFDRATPVPAEPTDAVPVAQAKQRQKTAVRALRAPGPRRIRPPYALGRQR
jgi:uncharacterized protein YijF (DUF1287 family)